MSKRTANLFHPRMVMALLIGCGVATQVIFGPTKGNMYKFTITLTGG